MIINLTGYSRGRITVLELSHTNASGSKVWLCQCACGKTTLKTTSAIKDQKNKTPSCGCAKKDSIKKAHAASVKAGTKFSHHLKPRLVCMFKNMHSRCYNPRNKRYSDWGGRGIGICQEWAQDRRRFYQWAIENGYRPGLSINRKHNDRDYSPGNCEFTDGITQANNSRKNVFIEWKGRRQTMAQWAREIGINPVVLRKRFLRGWSIERALSKRGGVE